MGPAVVAIVAKVAVGAVVGKLVGKITGNEFLGAMAGAFVGAGFSMNTATGAMSWSTDNIGSMFSGAAEGTGAAGADVVSAGFGDVLGSTSDVLGGATAESITPGAFSEVAGAATEGGVLESMVPDAVSKAAETGGSLSSVFDKGASWINDNSKFSEIALTGIQGAFGPDKIDEIEATGEQERLTAEQKQKNKEAVDYKELEGKLAGVNQDVFAGGYKPSGMLSESLRDYNPRYSAMASPNYESRLNAIRMRPNQEPEEIA